MRLAPIARPEAVEMADSVVLRVHWPFDQARRPTVPCGWCACSPAEDSLKSSLLEFFAGPTGRTESHSGLKDDRDQIQSALSLTCTLKKGPIM